MSLANIFDTAEVKTAATDDRDWDVDVIPDGGPYKAEIVDFGCFREKDGERIFVSWKFVVKSPSALSGKRVERFMMLKDNTAGMVKSDLLKVLAYTPKFEDLHDEQTGRTGKVRHDIVGARVEIFQSKTESGGKVYVNINMARKLSDPPKREPTPEPEAEPEPKATVEADWILQDGAEEHNGMTVAGIVERLGNDRATALDALVWRPGFPEWRCPVGLGHFADFFPEPAAKPPRLPALPTSDDWADVEEGDVPF